ncbi:MAG TPA: acyl-CoA dehydrogenase family protein [Myxococcota bacterium]|jgi:alkylation response protein AidB-like acyl-CoA dehydrogenase|nr:acyl-CoA dehydrogenase family protein [Myxococcota bacterium]
MFDFALPPELALLQESVRAFAMERLRPRERVHEAARAVAPEVAALHRELGVGVLELPEALGGAGLGALARAVVSEELAAGDAGAAVALDPLGPALYALSELGGEEALRRHALPLLVRTGARAVLAVDPAPRLRTEGRLVQGALPYVPADRVDLLVVLERERAYVCTGPFSVSPLRGAGLRAAGASELVIAGEARLLDEWVSTPRARRALARTRLLVAAMLVGVARASSEYARRYALERVAFGRPIAHHQALAFLLVDMASAVEAARLLLWQAAVALDADADDSADALCASAFVEAAEAALFVTPNGVQVLGGHGFMQDHPVEKWMREARTLSLLAGGVDLAREDAGRRLVGQGDAPLALAGGAV